MADLVVPSLAPVVVVPGTSLDVITLAEAKTGLNITDTDTDAELAQVITAASRFVDSVYGAVVARTITDEQHTGGGSRIWLRQRPVASITTVTEYASGTPTVLTAETLAASGTYAVDLGMGYIRRRDSWYDSRFATSGVLVTYVAGRYATTAAVDPKFKEAGVIAVQHLMQHRGAQSGAATFGGEGAPFAGVPFSSSVLRDKLIALFPEEWLGPVVA